MGEDHRRVFLVEFVVIGVLDQFEKEVGWAFVELVCQTGKAMLAFCCMLYYVCCIEVIRAT